MTITDLAGESLGCTKTAEQEKRQELCALLFSSLESRRSDTFCSTVRKVGVNEDQVCLALVG